MADNTKQWKLGLIDSACFVTEFEGQPVREQARKIDFETMDLFVGFDVGKMPRAERDTYIKKRTECRLAIYFAGMHLLGSQ